MSRSLAEFPVLEQIESPLTYDEVYHFMEFGYVVVSGLIPREVARRADEAAYSVTSLDPQNPESFKNAKHSTFCEHPDLMAVYTPAYLIAAAQIASTDPHMFNRSRVPTNAYVITTAPSPGPWVVSGEHVDGAGDWKSIVNSFPRPWQMFTMIYLHDVGPHEGATVVYPKSHRKLQALLRSEPERYRFLAQMVDDMGRVDLGEPVELLARAGDVAFVDQMTVHAGSKNTGNRPRFAMNMKW